ncbi:TonB-dependent receptor, partial [Campylobacter jejuni]
GAPFVPSKASQYEVGLKYQPTGVDALFTVSAFDIRQRDALVPDTFGFNTQEGRIRSRGLEFEARGQVTNNLELIAALTLLDTKVTQAAV